MRWFKYFRPRNVASTSQDVVDDQIDLVNEIRDGKEQPLAAHFFALFLVFKPAGRFRVWRAPLHINALSLERA